MDGGESGEFSDELDEFEESIDETKQKNLRNQTSYTNKPYDEAYEVSQDLSMAESFDGRGDKHDKEKKLRNDKYDEAVEVSQSLDQVNIAQTKLAHPTMTSSAKDEKEAKGLSKGDEQSKSQSVLNKPFDEALEFSRSGSEESVETTDDKNQNSSTAMAITKEKAEHKTNPQPMMGQQQQLQDQLQSGRPQVQTTIAHKDPGDDESGSEESGGDHEESYDNLEGAYSAKDYSTLNVTVEVRDLFQYIERYKPHEVELDAPLKCFIPEYIPAIGELDAFIKIPRPDEKEDGLGLRYLDEPSSNQSDPTVLELQLRAKSKKLQYGDVAVRSIEHADKNPAKVDKWIQDINELHRSKPPPQVNYKKNMPDIDQLMDIWPEEFEAMLATTQLPSPDLDMSLSEYAKTLCTILDIPTYENPIESLHLMFSLFIDFRNNPHFQSRLLNGGGIGGADAKESSKNGFQNKGEYNNFGNADVLAIEQG